jgi:aldose 1-epimerase
MNKYFFLSFVFCLISFLHSCKNKETKTVRMEQGKAELTKTNFGTNKDGTVVYKYFLANKNGMTIDIITYGGIITSLKVPDRNGEISNIVLGFDSLSQYITNNPYFGALIGRYGNRIAKGKFTLDGIEYQLETNNAPNHLHGGSKGFDKVVWDVLASEKNDSISTLKLGYTSADMEMGYPGKLNVIVTYTLHNDNSLAVKYEGYADKKTIVNLTQHSYFNLSGDFKNTILDHEVVIAADKYLPVDATLIPTGKLLDVSNTPFDFRISKSIGKDISVNDEQINRGKGYDHCWVLNGNGMRSVSNVYHPISGRMLEILTDEPGIQFYTGNFLDGTLPAYGGGTYALRSGFCLETQHFPDSPNQKSFPSVELLPGQKYESNTVFKFSIK